MRNGIPCVAGVIGRLPPLAIAERAVEVAPIGRPVGLFVDERHRVWVDDVDAGEPSHLLRVIRRNSDPDGIAYEIECEAETRRRIYRKSKRVKRKVAA